MCRPDGPEPDVRGLLEPARRHRRGHRNLWFHTGDLGRIDDDGYLYFVDRKKDALRRRGENISSFEMEKVLYGHDAIRDVAVHAVPSPLGEDDVKVTCVLQDGAARQRRGAVPVGGRAGAVLRDPALRRVPRRPAPQPGRAGA